MSAANSAPAARVVLLGASNLARGISTSVESAGLAWGRPLSIFAALGHGRSYGLRTTLLGRALPGIAACGLWDALRSAAPTPTWGVLTDVGNDLLYDVPPTTIAAWVGECLRRLTDGGARVALAELPLENLRGLSRAKFYAFRAVFFPGCRLSYDAVLGRALELNDRLRGLGGGPLVKLIAPRPEWYGVDPIHIRRRAWRAAWREMLYAWRDDAPPLARGSLRRWIYLRTRRPAHYWRFHVERRAHQPAGVLRDGTTVSMF